MQANRYVHWVNREKIQYLSWRLNNIYCVPEGKDFRKHVYIVYIFEIYSWCSFNTALKDNACFKGDWILCSIIILLTNKPQYYSDFLLPVNNYTTVRQCIFFRLLVLFKLIHCNIVNFSTNNDWLYGVLHHISNISAI